MQGLTKRLKLGTLKKARKKSTLAFAGWHTFFSAFVFKRRISVCTFNMASSSNQDIEKSSPPNSSGSENGFLDILAAQESFFTQIDSIMTALGTKETNAEGLVTLEPKYIKTLQDIVGNMKVRNSGQKTIFFCNFLFPRFLLTNYA